jgi:hypothetical protein
MYITDLRNASFRASRTALPTSQFAARSQGVRTAFLSHSHKDKDAAKGLQVILAEQGFVVYIDWEDPYMPDTPDRRTAERIQQRIRETDFLLFLATDNSTESRWCPWEIGFADGVKPTNSIIIIPTRNSSGHWSGNEYLQLYRSILPTTTGGYAIFAAGSNQGQTLRSI